MTAAPKSEARCIGEPISWLRLEQLALGELRDHGAADAHLAQCPACAATLAQIRADERALPPLMAPASAAGSKVRNADVRNADVRDADVAAVPWWRRAWLLGGGGLAAALAAVLLLIAVRRGSPGDDAVQTGSLLHVKGAGDVSVTLVRERDGAISFDPTDVSDGDRWKIQLTCARGGALWADVAIIQDGLTSHPLSPQRLSCGNAVVLPGAFRITDITKSGAEICVALDDKPPPRTRWRRNDRSGTVCQSLSTSTP